MFLFKKSNKALQLSSIQTNDEGKKVLTKTEDFRLFVIRNDDDAILGTVLLTEDQQSILNNSCNNHGIKFTRK